MRTKVISTPNGNKRVPLTPEEEIERDIDDAAFEAGRSNREAAIKIEALKDDPDMPSIEEKVNALLSDDAKEVAKIKARIAEVKTKHGVA